MSVYVAQLPAAFPVMLEVDADVAGEAIAILMEPFMGGVDGVELTQGSSFAHTSDATRPGIRRLWLSRVSLERLQSHGMFTEVPELKDFLYKE